MGHSMSTEARWRRFTDWAKHRPWLLSIADRFTRGTAPFRVLDHWPRLPRPIRPDTTGWETREQAACWLGHSTLLIRIAGKTVLTDPVFSPRLGLGFGLFTLGPRRLIAPALSIDQLPAIDVILLSHAHMDHLDRPSLRRLAKRFPRATVVALDGLRDLVDGLGFVSISELPVGESVTLDGLNVSTLATRHWGARTLRDTHRGYGSFLLSNATGGRILYGADAAFHEHWDHLSPTGGVDLAIIGIGAYDPWIDGHANPEQAYAMARACGARRMMPVHHSTFVLSREPLDEPLKRLTGHAKLHDSPTIVGSVMGSIV